MPAIRIAAGSRLHFGLLAPFAACGLRFGGCGLMVERPGLVLTLRPASAWSVEGPHAERVAALIAELQAPTKLGPLKPLRVAVESAASEHVGLGTGTQLSLAVAQGALLASGRPAAMVAELSRLTGRGKRSGVGLHGFVQGGFIHDGGRGPDDETPLLAARIEFPAAWRLLLALPSAEQGWAGQREAELFAQQTAPKPHLEERLAALIEEELAPSLRAPRFERFAAALFEYNRLAGEFYREVQGGAYSSPWLTEQIDRLRALGVVGVGQSSWGPTLFALCPSPEEADTLRRKLLPDPAYAGRELLVTAARNAGAGWTYAAE